MKKVVRTAKENMQLIWRVRRRIVAQLGAAPLATQSGLRASLRALDSLLRMNFENRNGGRKWWRN